MQTNSWKKIIVAFLLNALILNGFSQKYIEYVNPLIGTDAHGHTYPGASMPFGMIQLSPDTRTEGWDACSGYHYSDTTLLGFSHTHLSGTGVPDYCDILLLPFNEAFFTEFNQVKPNIKESFSHLNEKAYPGYYETKLNQSSIISKLTVSERCGFHKNIFPEKTSHCLMLDLSHRDNVLDSYIKVVNNKEIEGFRISKSWAKEQHIYFVIQLSEAIDQQKLYLNDIEIKKSDSCSGKNIKILLKTQKKSDELLIKIGISAVNIKNARLNLKNEIPHWDFEKSRMNSTEKWEQELSKIQIISEDKGKLQTFYTALYHSFLNPNIFMDVNGEFRGRDNLIHNSKGYNYYTLFSLWDTYRATHPLFTILQQKRTEDFIKTFIKQYEDGGLLPVWELAANETDCMIGYHAVSVIADAYIKGITDFDVKKALHAMKTSSNEKRFGKEYYINDGFIGSDKEHESISRTLEYAYDDWCIAQTALKLGDTNDYKTYIQRAQYYKNIFNHETGFMQPKTNHVWKSPFDAREVDFNYTEANAWQYSFYVPQDISGLIGLFGGEDVFESKLDRLFQEESETTGREQVDITGLIGQYAHGNEPSHHMAYLYNYIGKPWKTQAMVRRIMDELYSEKPDGLCGNEDCGQMSSWYVFSALGFYPVTPASNAYIIGSPVFEQSFIRLENGNTFNIIAHNVSGENKYIQSAKFNGVEYSKSYILHDDIMKGGTLEFTMNNIPNNNWGQDISDRPQSSINEHLILANPSIKSAKKIFEDSVIIDFNKNNNDRIFYSINSNNESSFKEFVSPITLKESTIIYAYSENQNKKSKIIEAVFRKINSTFKINIQPEAHPQYKAEGNSTLLDGLRGSSNFRLGEWIGFYFDDVIIDLEFKNSEILDTIAIGCLQDQNSWIFMPENIELYSSLDGEEFELIANIENTIDEHAENAVIKDFVAVIKKEVKYIKIIAKSKKYCPEWHKGYPFEGKTFIFMDEIVIK